METIFVAAFIIFILSLIIILILTAIDNSSHMVDSDSEDETDVTV